MSLPHPRSQRDGQNDPDGPVSPSASRLHRPVSPFRLIYERKSEILCAIEELEGAPWDVFGPQDVSATLGVSAQALNDWRYLGGSGRPPREDSRLYGGRSALYRKDRLRAWVEHGGLEQPARRLWVQGADYIETALGMPRPTDAESTDEMIRWLLAHGLLVLKVPPLLTPFAPYSDSPTAGPAVTASPPMLVSR